jgi:putative ABC transport system ATP-binding protein
MTDMTRHPGRVARHGALPQDGSPDGRLALCLDDAVKEYAGGVRALGGVSLEVAVGEQVAVVGASGSGKTTMLTVLGTLERASSGTVTVLGRDVAHASDVELAGLRAYEVGFVFQSFHLQDALTAAENVGLGMLYVGVNRRERRDAARTALERVGLGDRMTHRPPMLSGGERQRVAIARALVKRPAIILADEPTGNLDSKSGGDVLALLHQLASDGATLVLITHDHQIADGFPRQVQMRDGRIVADERS